jgi:hypothetical protein
MNASLTFTNSRVSSVLFKAFPFLEILTASIVNEWSCVKEEGEDKRFFHDKEKPLIPCHESWYLGLIDLR